jgi:hypothetical protein
MPVTGLSQVRANLRGVFNNIRQRKSSEFVSAVVTMGVAQSKELTPIEYSTLINSIVIDISHSTRFSKGTVFYMANYAAALEFGTWEPVSAANKEGPADNMSAEPHFLRNGFESEESKAHIKQLENIFRI